MSASEEKIRWINKAFPNENVTKCHRCLRGTDKVEPLYETFAIKLAVFFVTFLFLHRENIKEKHVSPYLQGSSAIFAQEQRRKGIKYLGGED